MDANFNANDYTCIELVSEIANIYYADTIADIKAIENIVYIGIITENWNLSESEPAEPTCMTTLPYRCFLGKMTAI